MIHICHGTFYIIFPYVFDENHVLTEDILVYYLLFQIDYNMGDITVKDSAHPSHLVKELVALRSAGELFDYVIKGTKESFHFHSLVLALVSPMFRAMLRSEMSESAKKEATFPSIPDNIIAKVIDYAYNGSCLLSQDHLMDLVKAAHYLQMSKLLKMCEKQIATVLQPSNCIPWLQLADKLQLTTIMLKVQKMMQTSYNDIIMTTDFKQLEKHELLQYLTHMREYGTCSDEILNGALQWIDHDVQNRQTLLEDLFGVVEIRKCSNTFLANMMDNYAELLDKHQNIYKLILYEVLQGNRTVKSGSQTNVTYVSNAPQTSAITQSSQQQHQQTAVSAAKQQLQQLNQHMVAPQPLLCAPTTAAYSQPRALRPATAMANQAASGGTVNGGMPAAPPAAPPQHTHPPPSTSDQKITSQQMGNKSTGNLVVGEEYVIQFSYGRKVVGTWEGKFFKIKPDKNQSKKQKYTWHN